jgi:hypothetical protein
MLKIKPLVYRVNAHAKYERLCKHMMQDEQKDVATAVGELNIFLELTKGKKRKKKCWFIVKESTIAGAGHGLFAD